MMNTLNGKLIVISAPSGTGKTSIVKALVNNSNDLIVSVSTTTRKPRPGELEGKDYFFVNKDKFEKLKNNDEFIEWAIVYGNFYGTSAKWVEKKIKTGKKILLEIDWQGAQQIRRKFKNSKNLITIFLKPPSLKELTKRLKDRGKDSDEIIKKRVSLATEDLAHALEFQHVIMNKKFDETLNKIENIIFS
ncbi:MAG: guanylate kinase [Betaproteobacteria bacterium TMED156]|nr:MAG: guanylate kinase [Betaproteobacteria bacterium TMED156]